MAKIEDVGVKNTTGATFGEKVENRDYYSNTGKLMNYSSKKHVSSKGFIYYGNLEY
ncbi:MAG: hypothetical protein RIG62_06935 [Cyclobacteriaceae bacterium]